MLYTCTCKIMESRFYSFILVSLFLGSINCDNTFFLVQSFDDGNFYCLTNSSYALAWIHEDSKAMNSGSTFVTESKLNIINPDWAVNNKQFKPYSQYPLGAMILDRRWEELEILVSGDVFRKPLVLPPHKSFRFPFSLRIEKNAHIFLCDGDSVTESNCYWLLLEGFNGTKTAVGKCKKGMLQFTNGIPVAGSCQQNLTEYSLDKYLSNKSWMHFDLLKLNNLITMSQTKGTRGRVIIDYQDEDVSTINPTHMFIYSNNVRGFWKTHFSKPDIYINEEVNKVQLGPVINVVDGSFCVSFFLLMCSQCQLELTLSNANKPSDVIFKQKYSSKINLYNRGTQTLAMLTEWVQIKNATNRVKSDKVILSISTSVRNMSEKFWAIDKVRLCQKNELRMITSKEELQCQLILDYATETLMKEKKTATTGTKRRESNGGSEMAKRHPNEQFHILSSLVNSAHIKRDIVLIEAEITTNNTDSKKYCPEDSVGRLCVPCLWTISQHCGRVKTCEKYRNNLECTCSAGYMGDNCDTTCPEGFYGHFCKNKCMECSHGFCDKMDGTCVPCRDNYTGSKCEIAPATIFAQAPTVKNIQYTNMLVEVNNFIIVNATNNDPPRYFTIQYNVNGDGEWFDSLENFEFGKKETHKIKNLEVDTKYYIRCVIITQSGRKYADERIPYTQATTRKCDAITESDISVQPLNTSANMYLLVPVLSAFCNFETFQILINNTDANEPKSITPNEAYFEKLTPFSDYEIILKNKIALIKKHFRSQEGVPEKVQNLTIAQILSNGVTLKWDKPTHIHGSLQHYVVMYQHVSYLKCAANTENQRPLELNVTTNYATLKGLEAYSKYSISVFCKNGKFTGDPQALTHITTGASDAIHLDEIPEIEQVVPKNVSVSIRLSEINCTKIRGLVWVNVAATCLSKWCRKNSTTQKFLGSSSDTSLQLIDLSPFSNYTLTIQFCRNDSYFCNDKVKTTQFQTESTISREVLVFSKNESSISLRWKLPDLATDIERLYKIRYKICGDGFQKTENLTKSPCTLWPTYYCHAIINLEKNREYCIKVSVINKTSENFIKSEEIVVRTSQEASKAPYDLRTDWSLNNDLNLQWKHPNETNGIIRHFNILLEPLMLEPSHYRNLNNISSILPVAPGEYKLVYRYKIEAEKILPSIKYNIKIAANNGLLGQELFGEVFSPPSVPLFAAEPKIGSSTTTITVDICLNITDTEKENIHKLFLFVSDKLSSQPELQEFKDKFNMTLDKLRIVCEHKFDTSDVFNFRIGDQSNDCGNKPNPPLTAGTNYNVTILIVNSFANRTKYKIYSFETTTGREHVLSSGLKLCVSIVATFITIAGIVTMMWLLYKYIKKQNFGHDSAIGSLDQELPLNQHDNYYCEDKSKESYYSNKIIDIKKFQEYVKMSLENRELYSQHQIILTNATKPVYDTIAKNLFLDYIDVHFVRDNDDVSKAYMVTEMPPHNKIDQFWQIVWDDNVQYIVLCSDVSTNQEDFTTYWPKGDETLRCDKIVIKLISFQNFSDYEQRRFSLNDQNETRYVNLLCFSSWLENDIPSSAFIFVPFFKKLSEVPLNPNSPILLHSSCGIQATRFVLLCDICLRTAAKDGFVDVFTNSEMLASRTVGMLDNPKHYLFAHLVILENLIVLDHDISYKFSDWQVPASVEHKKIKQFLNYMNETVWIDQSVKKLKREDCPQQNKLQLTPYLIEEEHEYAYIDTINTTTLDVFRNTMLMVAQQPTRFSVDYFWKLVEENDIHLIVSLNEPSSSENYPWWSSKYRQNVHLSKIKIGHKETVTLDNYVCTTIDIEGQVKTMAVKILSITKWPAKTNCPENVSVFVDFCIESSRIIKNSNSVMVTCNDGVTASGLYVAMLYNIRKWELEEECDVFATARIIRNNRQGFLREKEQLIFLWKSTENYLMKKIYSTKKNE